VPYCQASFMNSYAQVLGHLDSVGRSTRRAVPEFDLPV
jgi:hypothetical protein